MKKPANNLLAFAAGTLLSFGFLSGALEENADAMLQKIDANRVSGNKVILSGCCYLRSSEVPDIDYAYSPVGRP